MISSRRPRLTAALAAALALAAGGCDKHAYKMPSGSMIPTLAMGARFIADRGVKAPARGEVWVLEFPENRDQLFVKRLIGAPGDRLEQKGATLWINGAAVPSCVVGRWRTGEGGPNDEGDLVLEKLDGAAYLTFLDANTSAATGPWVVQPGEWFAIGDNRNNSHDSRSWNRGLGAGVPRALLVGRADLGPVTLPRGAESLAGAFAACKAKLGVP